jgi:type VI secretion system secreted protein VgrG
MADLSQANRIGVLTTPIPGVDALALTRFDGTEGLSETFEYRIEALSDLQDIDFNQALGRQCSVKLNTFKGEDRSFHGILTEAQWTGRKDDHFSYRLLLRPWLWLLTRTTDCRIFLDKKAPEIIKEVFTDRSFAQGTHWESRLENEGSFPKRDYCVQFRETDFNFVCRLMEKEGIYYYFTHKDGKHVLVLANAKSSHDPIQTMQESDRSRTATPQPELPFLPPAGGFVPAVQRIEQVISERQFRSGSVEITDYNYETPNAQMSHIELGEKRYERGDMEIFDCPGNHKDADQAARYAEIMLQAEQARDHRRQFSGEAPSLFPGGITKLKGHPAASQNIEYLVVRAKHSYGEQSYRSGGQGEAADGVYRGAYDVLPRDQQFRATIITPVPRIYGIQTAVVVDKQAKGRVDKSPEEIEVEKLTEIYVSFFWDRRQHKEKRSVKLRCAQLWAGKNWGAQFIPRIGMEVLVQFLEGDPDRPIVTGCVYNENNKPPGELAAKKTISGIKSESTKGDQGCNYWNFEDKKGGEQINFHAEKDLNVVVKNNETRSVGNNMTTTVANSEKRTIGKNFKPPTGANARETIIENGDEKLEVKNGAIFHEAKLKIELKVGPSKITITPANITLDAPTITLKATGPITIQGLPVKIN